MKTRINIETFPLSLVNSNDLQRCYIPDVEDSPNPTAKSYWGRCSLSNGSYAICRVVRRLGSEHCCFLDSAVTSSAQFPLTNQRLTSIESLTLVRNVMKVSCLVFANQNLPEKRPDLQLKDLAGYVKIYLRWLVLEKGCYVRLKLFSTLGIDAIQILDAPEVPDNQCFTLDNCAVMNIVDVRLAMPKYLPICTKYLSDSFEQPTEALEQLLATSKRSFLAHRFPTTALIVGPVGCGKTMLMAEFLRRHECSCFYILPNQGVIRPYPGGTESQLRKIFQAARTFKANMMPSTPIVIIIEDLELLCASSSSYSGGASQSSNNSLRIAAQFNKLIDELDPGIICLGTSSNPDHLHEHARRAGRFGREIAIEMPNEEQRGRLIKAWCQEYNMALPCGELIDHLAKNTQGYVISDLILLLSHVQKDVKVQGVSHLDKIFRKWLSHTFPSGSRATNVRVAKMTVGFEAIGGMDGLKRKLEASILAGLKHAEVFARLGLSLPKGVLLYGPPGCAKTTIAKCLAKEANMTFIATSAAEVYSPYVGCAERYITRMFHLARKNAPCLIFLDEIDSLVGRRTVSTGGGGGGGQVQLRILSTLLTEMDGIVGGTNEKHILVVAATNRPEMIDDALMRPGRFDKLIHVPAPDLRSRMALMELHGKRMPFDENLDLETIVRHTEGYSGADICNLCNEAAIQTFQRDPEATKIEMQDFEKVLYKLKSSLTQSQISAYYKFAQRSQ
ncbi:cell division cycle protein 48 homolog [Drosophila persimilis]|uniref:cell division cycle protein 48 homolog n=1 Tax=Drosophila persimilis TaxID=7234 RepID=UPI000F09496F|nr:cell division cycle protein 48 homolog [Drosophila persimilis]